MSGITKSQSFCSSAPFIPLAYFNDQEISGFKGALVAIKILELQSGSFITRAHDSLALEFLIIGQKMPNENEVTSYFP